MRRTACRAGALLCTVATLTAACSGSAPETIEALDAEQRAALERLLAEEDRRPPVAGATELRAALSSDVALLRRFAARGIGRLEDPSALGLLAPLLADADAAARAQAAAAIAQSTFNEPSATAAELLGDRLPDEPDAVVRGALAHALGRLRPVSPEAATNTLDVLVELTRDAPVETLLPTLRGLEWLVRTNAETLVIDPEATARLIELARYGRAGAEGHIEPEDGGATDTEAVLASARVRRLALATLRAASTLDAATVETALYDPDVEVRRLAAAAVGTVPEETMLPVLVQIAQADASGMVRYEGLRWYGRRLRLTGGCDPIVGAVEDEDAHVALLAIDLLAQGCRGIAGGDDDPRPAALLEELARALPGLSAAAATEDLPAPVAWHRGAHALVSLARLAPGAAEPLIPAFARNPVWQVRMYAARAADAAGAVDTLERLAGDPHPNVVDAALRGLLDHLGGAASPFAVAALASDDYQLLITAADALESSDDPAAPAALLAALARVTEQQRETSRDPRMALLERAGELGDAGNAAEVRPYVNDFDPRVAALAAQILTTWTGESVAPSPRPLPPQPFPGIDELLELQRAVARLHLPGGVVTIELYPFEAPTNVSRFARQAREGYFEGLTFHRVVPNFVVQGGSPGANEYVGAGPYTRDELTVRSHLRGTVGISTRGRDTGDGQIFINLVDNVRLDHNYTIIGSVREGMEVVDAVLEGTTIERVTVEPGGAPD